jgi:sensor histidine kinase regulating citrate/malate metabolism
VIALVFLLVDNAIKAVKKHPKERMEIQITLEVKDEMLWVRVKDNGCGMNDSQKAECSKEGFSEFGSSGLGLAIVYGFAALAGGGVEIETEVNQGTTVSVGIAKFKKV